MAMSDNRFFRVGLVIESRDLSTHGGLSIYRSDVPRPDGSRRRREQTCAQAAQSC